ARASQRNHGEKMAWKRKPKLEVTLGQVSPSSEGKDLMETSLRSLGYLVSGYPSSVRVSVSGFVLVSLIPLDLGDSKFLFGKLDMVLHTFDPHTLEGEEGRAKRSEHSPGNRTQRVVLVLNCVD
ncbi:hypothetical protein STEG23_026653, partial [Scotinomys teguina]